MVRRPVYKRNPSARTGERRAGSEAYANSRRPSDAATPSSAFSSPLKLSVLTSDSWSFLRPRRDDDVLFVDCSFVFSLDSPSGLPVEVPSRDVLRVNAASRSSKRTMHRAGTRPISVVSVLSFIHDDDRDTT